MAEQQQEPVSWNPVWREVFVQAIQQGRSVRMAIADADAAVMTTDPKAPILAEGVR
jgi:hypothetical protein